MIHKYYIGLGSNIESRLNYLKQAVNALNKLGTINQKSNIYESEPWGDKRQDKYLNAAINLETDLSPKDLLLKIKKTEQELGRKSRKRWGPREIDIDILWSDAPDINDPELQIPHKHLEQRRFVLVALADITESLHLGGRRRNLDDLIDMCDDKSTVDKLNLSW